MHQVGTSSLLIYMMHGHTYIKGLNRFTGCMGGKMERQGNDRAGDYSFSYGKIKQ